MPPNERTTLESLRQFTGGIAGLLAGFVIRYVLDERVALFPGSYSLLLCLSGVAFGMAILALGAVVEPRLPTRPRQISVIGQLKRGPAILRQDRRYALYIGVRAAASGLTLASPFYILYAIDILGAPASMAGIYVAIRTLARVGSNIYWGLLSKKRGGLWLLKHSFVVGVVAPLGAVLIDLTRPALWPGQAAEVGIWLCALVFAFEGMASSANRIGQVAYLYEIAPDVERPTYFGLANTLLGPLYFLPALGGALLDAVGFAPILILAASLIALAYALARRLSAGE